MRRRARGEERRHERQGVGTDAAPSHESGSAAILEPDWCRDPGGA
jgi:hypothetical protein